MGPDARTNRAAAPAETGQAVDSAWRVLLSVRHGLAWSLTGETALTVLEERRCLAHETE
jgi:hypothetical protein